MENQKTAVIRIFIPFVNTDPLNKEDICVIGDRSARMEYLDALALEAQSVAADFDDYVIRAISVEGPMPSIMSPDGLGGLLKRLGELFRLEAGCEISIAAYPHTVGVPSLTGWGLGKVNRIVLRAESLQVAELSSLKLPFDTVDIQNAFLFFDKFRMRNVDAELTVGIPGQSESSLLRSVRSLTSIDVPHITLKPFATGASDSDLHSERALFAAACDRLVEAGYDHYSPGRFAKRGASSSALVEALAHDASVIGIGLGALTFDSGIAYRNTVDYGDYTGNPCDVGIVVGNAVRLDEFSLAALTAGRSLMSSEGFDASALDGFGEGGKRILHELSSLEEDGLLVRCGSSFRLTRDGCFSWLFEKDRSPIMEAAGLIG